MTDQPMTRDEFYERFPWVFNLPERPQCSECWNVSFYEAKDGYVWLIESHREDCSRYGHEQDAQLYRTTEEWVR